MDRHDHGLVLVDSQFLEIAADDESSQGVQPRGRLVEDYHRRIADQLEGN